MQAYCLVLCSKVEPTNPSHFAVFCFDDDYIIDTAKAKRISRIIKHVDNPHVYSIMWDSKIDAMRRFGTMGVPFERILDMGKLSKWDDLRDCFNKYARIPGKHGFYTISGYDFQEAEEYNC